MMRLFRPKISGAPAGDDSGPLPLEPTPHSPPAAAAVDAMSAAFDRGAGAPEAPLHVVDEILAANERLLGRASEATAVFDDAAFAMQNLAVATDMARNTAAAMSLAMDGLRQSSVTITAELQHSSQAADGVTGFAGRARDGAAALEVSVNEIGAIVDLIAGLASQTSLLAINAAIEAARAGEGGRGFSVVAAEVKLLANATRQATTDVADVIRKVRQSAFRSIAEVSALDGAIADLRGALGRVGGALDIQTGSAGEIADSAHEALRMADLVEEGRNRLAEMQRRSEAAFREVETAARSSQSAALTLRASLGGGGAVPSGGLLAQPAGARAVSM